MDAWRVIVNLERVIVLLTASKRITSYVYFIPSGMQLWLICMIKCKNNVLNNIYPAMQHIW